MHFPTQTNLWFFDSINYIKYLKHIEYIKHKTKYISVV